MTLVIESCWLLSLHWRVAPLVGGFGGAFHSLDRSHKTLSTSSAKRLNSRQARWALFFGRFDFSISYHPGSKNIKPDALSRIFDRSERPSSPESILPEKFVVSMVTWEIESKVRSALQGVTPPSNCPPSHLFVPESLRSDVIRWGHCSKVACHPGVRRTFFLVKQRFWWQSMARDTLDFVLACSVCASCKTSNRPPGTSSAAVSPFETLVPHFARFCYSPCPLSGQHGGFDRSGPVLEGGPFHPSA